MYVDLDDECMVTDDDIALVAFKYSIATTDARNSGHS